MGKSRGTPITIELLANDLPRLPTPKGIFPRLTNLKLNLLEDPRKLNQVAKTSVFNEPPPKSNKFFTYFVPRGLQEESDFEQQRLDMTKVKWFDSGNENSGPPPVSASTPGVDVSTLDQEFMSPIGAGVGPGGFDEDYGTITGQLETEYLDKEWETTDADRNFVHLLNEVKHEGGGIGERGLSFLEIEAQYDRSGFGEIQEESEYDYESGGVSGLFEQSDGEVCDQSLFEFEGEEVESSDESDESPLPPKKKKKKTRVVSDYDEESVCEIDDEYEEDEEEEKLTAQECLYRLRSMCKGLKRSRPDLVKFIKSHNFTYASDPEVMTMVYEDVKNELQMGSVLVQYKMIIMAASYVLEQAIESYLPQHSIKGFLRHQIKNMEDYDMLLLELGEENAYGLIGGSTPVELRLVFAIMMSAGGFYGIKRLGFNPVTMLQNSFGDNYIDDEDEGERGTPEEARQERMEELRNKYKSKSE